MPLGLSGRSDAPSCAKRLRFSYVQCGPCVLSLHKKNSHAVRQQRSSSAVLAAPLAHRTG